MNDRRIAFSSDRLYRSYEIYVMNADGTCITKLTDFGRHDAYSPRWSPDGSQILFELHFNQVFGSAWFDTDIYVVAADGSRVTRLTRRGENFGGQWSPDGSRIAFRSDRDGYPTLYVMDADGSHETKLTDMISRGRVAWSPDGTRIAFTAVSSEREEGEVYVVNTDGSSLTNLTNDPVADMFLTWTPNQDKVLFKSNRIIDGQEARRLYMVNADGTNVQQLIDLDTPNYHLNARGWVPTATLQLILDGEKQTHILDIECALDNQPPWSKIDFVPEECYRSAHEPSDPYSPAISLYECPGAPQFTYEVVRGVGGYVADNGGYDIVVMNFDGTGITNLTNCSAINMDPDWSP